MPLGIKRERWWLQQGMEICTNWAACNLPLNIHFINGKRNSISQVAGTLDVSVSQLLTSPHVTAAALLVTWKVVTEIEIFIQAEG